MGRRALQLVPAAMVLAACASGPLPPGFDPAWVTITVVDAQQRPIAGADVTGPGASARTDTRGQARLPWSQHDTLREFGVSAVGFVGTDEGWHGSDQRIVLQRDEPIRVRVLEAGTDRPLAGVRVTSLFSKHASITDDGGFAEARGVAPLAGSMPPLRLFRWRDDCFQWGYWKFRGSPREQPIALEHGTYVVRLRAEPLTAFVLRAAPGRRFAESIRVEADGEPVPNVVVEDGGQQLRCRLAVSMHPVVRVPGHEDVFAYWQPTATEPVVVDLRAGVRCSGRVLGPDGPIAGARVTLHWERGAQDVWRAVTTGSDGRWSARDCPRDGPIWMGVGAAGHLETGMAVPVVHDGEPPGTDDVALGDVRLEHEQLVVARLDPSWRGQSVQLWTTVTDGLRITGVAWSTLDGVVVLRGLEPGTHFLRWRIGDEEHHRLFTLDGSRTVVDLGDLPGAAPPPR